MKKLRKSLSIALALAASLAFMLTGCATHDSGNDDNEDDGSKIVSPDDGNNSLIEEDGDGSIKLTVGRNTATYSTIAKALEAATSVSGDCLITLVTGTYEEDGLSYSGKNNLKIKGLGTAEYGSDVVILGQGSDITSEKGRSTFAIAGSGNIILENLTIKSTRQNVTGDAQAEVIGTDGTGNLAAYNCSFLSGQDTLRTVAKAWFYKCYIEGDVDFLWMEYTNGVAALYEECVLHAIGSRTTKAYFTAPRLGLTSKVGKGLVVYNSKLEADSGLEKVYLGRNPWSSSAMSSYYEQVAFVGTTYDNSNVELNTDIWGSAANGTTDQKYIGFKTDKNFAAGKYGTVIDDEFVATEYAGRENILNRLYVVVSEKFQKDTDGYWDVNALAEENGWEVTADTSKSLLEGETEAESKTYDFSNDISTYTDITVGATAFENESGKSHIQGQAGATLSFPVTGNCIVTVTGYYKGEGSIQAGSQGKALFDFNNGSTTKMIEKTYVVYSGACDVTITASATTYITKISVEYDASLTFNPVTAITLSTAENATEVASKKTLQFSATLSPDSPTNDDIVWSITSGDSVASIDQNGLLTAGSADADTSVTVRATSCDANAVYGEKTITVKKLEANAFDISWLDSDAHSDVSNVACTDGNDSIATGGAGSLSTGTVAGTSYGSWQKNSSKWGTAAGGLSFVTSVASVAGWDAIYIDFPVKAVTALTIENVKVTYGDHGTGNPLGQVSYSTDGAETFNIIGTDIADNRKTTNSYDTSVTLSAGSTAIIRVALGHSADGKIAASKSPTICTVVVSGTAQ